MGLLSYFGYGSSKATTQQTVVDRPIQESTPTLSSEPCSSTQDASYFQRSYNSLVKSGGHITGACSSFTSAAISLSQVLGSVDIRNHLKEIRVAAKSINA